MSFSTNIIKFKRVKNVIFSGNICIYLRKMPQNAMLTLWLGLLWIPLAAIITMLASRYQSSTRVTNYLGNFLLIQ